MKTYKELINNPEEIKVKENATTVKFYLVSCMCDNQYIFTFDKLDNGYNLSTDCFAYSNFDIPVDSFELELAADDQKWDWIANNINKGFQKVGKVLSR